MFSNPKIAFNHQPPPLPLSLRSLPPFTLTLLPSLHISPFTLTLVSKQGSPFENIIHYPSESYLVTSLKEGLLKAGIEDYLLGKASKPSTFFPSPLK